MIGLRILRPHVRTFSYNFAKQPLIPPRFQANLRAFRRARDQKTTTNYTSNFGTVNKNAVMIAAGGALGLGGLCLYGLVSGPKDSLSAIDEAVYWPDHVKERIRSTYGYLLGSTVICAGTALQLSRNLAFISRFSTGIAAPLVMMACSIGCGIVCRMIPYPEGSGFLTTKHASWLVYSASLGAMVAPICLVGGPLLTSAAMYTAGIVGGLSLVAATAPSDKFLYMGGPLAIGLGVVFVSSLGTMFASPVGRLGMGLHAVSLYGGLALFSAFLLYDTQKIVHRAKNTPKLPVHSYNAQVRPYDPINNSMNVLLDAINIFVRMVTILSGSGSRRK